MFQVIGDTIYFHGQPLAVITMPLSGMKIEAIDALNMVNYHPAEDVADIIREVRGDVNQVVNDTLLEAVKAVWINDAQLEWIKSTADKLLNERLCSTWNSWNIDR